MQKGLLIGLVCLMVSSSAMALPQPICLPREKLVEVLEKLYGEVVVYIGILGKGEALMEVWISEETKTWSIMFTPPRGSSCIIATGREWQKSKHKGVKGEGI